MVGCDSAAEVRVRDGVDICWILGSVVLGWRCWVNSTAAQVTSFLPSQSSLMGSVTPIFAL